MTDRITPSPKTETAMRRMRQSVYALMAVLVIGAIVSAASVVVLLQRLETQAGHIEELVDSNAQVLQGDAQNDAQSEARLKRALEAVQEQFQRNDEASATRDEAILHAIEHLRDEIAAITPTDAPEPEHSAPSTLPRRNEAPQSPRPAEPAPQGRPIPPAPPAPDRCNVRLLGVCLS